MFIIALDVLRVAEGGVFPVRSLLKERTPNIHCFVAKLAIVVIITLLKGFRRSFNESQHAFRGLSKMSACLCLLVNSLLSDRLRKAHIGFGEISEKVSLLLKSFQQKSVCFRTVEVIY